MVHNSDLTNFRHAELIIVLRDYTVYSQIQNYWDIRHYWDTVIEFVYLCWDLLLLRHYWHIIRVLSCQFIKTEKIYVFVGLYFWKYGISFSYVLKFTLKIDIFQFSLNWNSSSKSVKIFQIVFYKFVLFNPISFRFYNFTFKNFKNFLDYFDLTYTQKIKFYVSTNKMHSLK